MENKLKKRTTVGLGGVITLIGAHMAPGVTLTGDETHDVVAIGIAVLGQVLMYGFECVRDRPKVVEAVVAATADGNVSNREIEEIREAWGEYQNQKFDPADVD